MLKELQGKKVVMKMIYAVKDILMLMYLEKQKNSLTKNFTLIRLVPP